MLRIPPHWQGMEQCGTLPQRGFGCEIQNTAYSPRLVKWPGSGVSTVKLTSLGVCRAMWETLQVNTVPGGYSDGRTMRKDARENVPSLCWRWLERDDPFVRETLSVSEGSWENHSTCIEPKRSQLISVNKCSVSLLRLLKIIC